MMNGIDADLQMLLALDWHYNPTTGFKFHLWALSPMCLHSVYQTSLLMVKSPRPFPL